MVKRAFHPKTDIESLHAGERSLLSFRKLKKGAGQANIMMFEEVSEK
jgi:hypothetical protein